MSTNFLHLNESKTEIIVFGPVSSSDTLKAKFSQFKFDLKPHVKNLGYIIDSHFKMDKQVNSIVRSCFFHLRQISKIKPFLNFMDTKKIIHALTLSRLDYCNSLYLGISHSVLSRLQLVQNSAARLLTRTRKWEHITPVLASLHWLPVRYRIDFKVLIFVYQSIHKYAPTYLSDLISIHQPSRMLRSANQIQLKVPRSRLKHRGDRAFQVAGPNLWNSLPQYIRSAPTLSIFKHKLKDYFFSLAIK